MRSRPLNTTQSTTYCKITQLGAFNHTAIPAAHLTDAVAASHSLQVILRRQQTDSNSSSKKLGMSDANALTADGCSDHHAALQLSCKFETCATHEGLQPSAVSCAAGWLTQTKSKSTLPGASSSACEPHLWVPV
jgi:hypothetical protein